jgi:hypothetical protein
MPMNRGARRQGVRRFRLSLAHSWSIARSNVTSAQRERVHVFLL